MEDIPAELITDCAQLVKANSIMGERRRGRDERERERGSVRGGGVRGEGGSVGEGEGEGERGIWQVRVVEMNILIVEVHPS